MTIRKHELQRAIALIRGGLDSLRFSAPENAHIFYERFDEAAKILEDGVAKKKASV